MSCLAALIDSVLHPHLHTLELRFTTPIGFWTW